MQHWGIYVAYGWLATIVVAFTDAVQAIRKGATNCLKSTCDLSLPRGTMSGIGQIAVAVVQWTFS